MDINPLIVDLNKYKDELADTIEIAIGFKELNKADEYVARNMAEIKGKTHSDQPFQQVADMYNLPVEEVIANIRDFTNKTYRDVIWSGLDFIEDIVVLIF